jgi:hypothetical protein
LSLNHHRGGQKLACIAVVFSSILAFSITLFRKMTTANIAIVMELGQFSIKEVADLLDHGQHHFLEFSVALWGDDFSQFVGLLGLLC